MIPTKEEWIKALEERHGQTLQQKFASASVAVCGLGDWALTFPSVLQEPESAD